MIAYSPAVKIIDPNGIPQGILVEDTRLSTMAKDYFVGVAEGDISGHESWAKIGYTPTLTTTESDLWSAAGVYTFPATGMRMEVVSSDNTQDTPTGTGARQVTIYYLDNSYVEQTTTLYVSGTTASPTTPINIQRVNGFRVTAAGSTGKPLGALTLRGFGGGSTYSYITAGFTRARNSVYTVPAGKTLYVNSVTFGFGYAANQTHYARLYTRATQNDGVRTPGIFYPFTEVICANTSQYVHLIIPTKIVEKVDIKVSGISSVSGVATVSLRGWEET